MPSNATATLGSHGMKPVAHLALVVTACIGLAGCGSGPAGGHPDLVVEAPAVSDDHPGAGAGFTFSATVRNAGAGTAAATTLRFYRSDDTAITTADTELDAADVAEAVASAASRFQSDLTAPSSPGTYYYGACVDAVAGESNTANNCSAATQVTVPEVRDTEPASPRPDLVVESPAVSAATQTAGTSFTFSATVRNAGDGSAAATTLSVYRSDDATVTTLDQEVDAVTVPELAALESSAASVELSAPSSSGTYYYGACVHAVAEESATANNCSEAVQVTVSEPPRPDLVVDRVRVSPASPPIGGILELATVVRNRGSTTTASPMLRFYRSTDATITRSDTQSATRWVTRSGIDSNNQPLYVYLEAVFVKVPSSQGVYYYGACVDAVAGESATTNNCSAAVKVEVSRNEPDLWVGTWTVPRSRPIGESLSLGTRVFNDGSPSEATTLRLLLLPDRTSAPSAGTQVGEVDVPELVVTHDWPVSSERLVEFEAPATAGWYYYVMCVDAVPRESDTTNNCSSATPVEFR